MAGKTPTEKIAELAAQVQRLELALETHKTVTKLKFDEQQRQLDDQKKREDELLTKVFDLVAKNAALEERARGQEKQTDRGFNFVQAAIICVISMVGGALLSQLGVKK